MLYLLYFKTCTFVFLATSNKREIAVQQKMDETNNISGRSHEIHLALTSENGTDK